MFTPGLVFLGRISLKLGIFASSVALLRHYTTELVPKWVFFTTLSLGIPTFVYLRISYNDWWHRRQAARMGARMVPKVQGKLPGNLDVIFTMRNYYRTGYPGDGLDDFTAKLGHVFDLNVLWESMVFTTTPEDIKRILATDFNNYVKGERFQAGMSSVLGSGVFNSDGEMWKFHRSMTRPFFTRDRISHFELFGRHGDEAISLMKQRLRTGNSIDFQDLMARFTLDSASEFLFGSCVDVLSAGLPYAHNASYIPPDSQTARGKKASEFAQAFLEAQDHIADRERTGKLWPLLEIFSDRTAKPMKIVNAYLEPIIAEALAKRDAKGPHCEKSVDEIDEDETLLDHLVEMTRDPKVLRDETLNIMIAGRDTTAATLTFIMYFLSKYPDIAVRLRKEVLEKVGPVRKPAHEDIKEMKLLRAVINETMRLYPVVPFNVRESVEATTWPSPDPGEKPLYIPANAKIPYSIFMMHRRKDLWGPDADEFDPERFLDERLKKYITPRPFAFLPFNAGPRICLGQQFAYNEMSFMLVRLMQNFVSFSLDLDACPPEFKAPNEWKTAQGRKAIDTFFPKMNLTMYTGGGLWIKAKEAETL